MLEELSTRSQREPVVGTGRGGDETTAIDAAAERAIVRRLESTEIDGVLVSEELGELQLGAGGDARVVLDPIDGSLNAKRGIGFFSLSIAFAHGPTMDDVDFGFVHDFGTNEEWTAVRGGGASLNGQPLGDERPKASIEILAFEATRTSLVAEKAPAVLHPARSGARSV